MTNEWTIAEEPALRGYLVEWAAAGDFIVSKRNRLYRSTTGRPPFTLVGVFPAPFWKGQIARWRLAQRALRFGYYNVLRLPDETLFVTFDKSIGVFDGGRFRGLAGLVQPCRVFRGGGALDSDGTLFFGEYVPNERRDDPVRVYCYRPGSERIEVVHEFPPGTVRHVHGIYRDPYTASLWCVTGDRGDECRILRTTDQFRVLDTVGAGDESWRCVHPLFTPQAVYYASDSEFARNHIYRIDRQSGDRSVVTEIGGPVYHAHAVGTDLFFSVGVEWCPSQEGRSATLWHVNEQGACAEILAFEKDRFPARYFQYGTLCFPCGPGLADEFFFHGVALRGADKRTFRARRRASRTEVDEGTGEI